MSLERGSTVLQINAPNIGLHKIPGNSFYAFTDTTTRHSLSCYICSSKASWEDCERQARVEECPHDINDVCIKIKTTRLVITQNGTQEQTTTYSKSCDTTDGCSDKECRELGWRCNVDCCHQNMCNSSVTMTTSVSTSYAPACVLFIVIAKFVNLEL